ncbi:MAG: type II secretion system F family protein, partial [Actinobacteria bacterium]|nr:type II secretion system F family protein [Actinomycetota bacterium]
PAFAVAAVALGPAAGVVAGAAGATVALRRSPAASSDVPAGGAAEAVELVMVGLLAGLTARDAVATAGRLGPTAAREPLEAAARRLHGGWSPDAAFADGGLSDLGAVLAACARWGAPVRPALRRLADDLRADRRAAAEEAAERAQLALVFPTTLLTLPAFVLAVVPPLLWTAFAGAVG